MSYCKFQRALKWMTIALVSLLLVQSVIAAGSSTGTVPRKNAAADTTTTSSNYNGSKKSTTTLDCEQYSSIKARVQCRLEQHSEAWVVPEPCRGSTNNEECVQLYREAKDCLR